VKPGLHFGGLAGFRLSELVSINGELAFDSVDLNGPRDERFTELDSTATLSPLVSITAGKVDLVFGPKLGAWVASYNQSSVSRGDGSGTFWGLDLGTSFATLTQVSRRLWLGGLASFDLRIYRKICFTPTGGIEGCASTDLPPADKVVSFSALLMFSP
jgi:hypothetical protein